MTAQILDGELVAAAIKADLVQRVEALANEGSRPGWARSWWATTARAPTTSP